MYSVVPTSLLYVPQAMEWRRNSLLLQWKIRLQVMSCALRFVRLEQQEQVSNTSYIVKGKHECQQRQLGNRVEKVL